MKIKNSNEVSYFSNYIPISLLPLMHKIFEYVIMDHLTDLILSKIIIYYVLNNLGFAQVF